MAFSLSQSDSRKCLVRPGSLMPCVSYTLPRTLASCDCRLRKYPIIFFFIFQSLRYLQSTFSLFFILTILTVIFFFILHLYDIYSYFSLLSIFTIFTFICFFILHLYDIYTYLFLYFPSKQYLQSMFSLFTIFTISTVIFSLFSIFTIFTVKVFFILHLYDIDSHLFLYSPSSRY